MPHWREGIRPLLPFKIGLMNGQEARGSGLQKTGPRQQRPSSLCRSSRDPRYVARKAETYLTSAHRRPSLFRFGTRALRLQRSALRPRRQLRLLRDRRGRGKLEGVSKPPLFASCVAVADPSWRLRWSEAKLDCTITISACNTTSALSSLAAEPWP